MNVTGETSGLGEVGLVEVGVGASEALFITAEGTPVLTSTEKARDSASAKRPEAQRHLRQAEPPGGGGEG